MAASLEARQFVVTLLGFFAAMAPLMATFGLYGVISYACVRGDQRNWRSDGVRRPSTAGVAPRGMVSGARTRDAAGSGRRGSGLAAFILFSRWFGSQLFTVGPFDPLTFVAVAAVLILAALLASYIPAARAARVDPANALRYE